MPTSLFSAVNPANADVLAIKLAVDCETPDFMVHAVPHHATAASDRW